MEKGNEPSASTSESSHKTRKTSLCSACRKETKKGACSCSGQSRWRKKKVATVEPVDVTSVPLHLPNGRSLLKHTKTKLSNVPDAGTLRPSSQTKSKECSAGGETKLLLDDIRIGKECLKYDKEAVTVGVDSNFGTEPKHIFENDFDCLDSTTLLNDKSSQTCEERRISLERTPEKGSARLDVPGAPQKKQREPPGTPNDHGEYSVRQPRHSCPFCSKIFRSNGKLNSHVFSHTGERPFACKHCHKAFSSKFKLVRHLLIHSEDRKFLCTVCERRFIRNDHLKNHYKVHDPRKVVFRCERAGCEKEYSSALSQRKHEAWHRAQDGDLTCLLCGVKQETAADLLVHLRRHSGSRLLKSPTDRKFRCHVCERNFLTRKDVTRHLVVHTGERDFLCQFCPQRFGRKDHLVRHIKKSHVGPAKRKVNKSIVTLNKSKATKAKRVAVGSKSKDIVAVKEEVEVDDEFDEDDEDGGKDVVDCANKRTDGGISSSDVQSDVESVPTGVCAELLVPSVPTNIVILPASSILVVQTPSAPGPSMELSSVSEPAQSEPTLGLFPYPETGNANFDMSASEDSLLLETGRQMKLLDAQARKGGDLFEGPSQSLMFSEPSFDEEDYKSGDLMLNQPDQSSGELLRYLLQADADAPLPGFSQIFNSCPSSSS